VFKKIEKQILFIPFLPLDLAQLGLASVRPVSFFPAFPPWAGLTTTNPCRPSLRGPAMRRSSLRLVSLTGGPYMSALSSILNRTRVRLRRRVHVRRHHDSFRWRAPHGLRPLNTNCIRAILLSRSEQAKAAPSPSQRRRKL